MQFPGWNQPKLRCIVLRSCLSWLDHNLLILEFYENRRIDYANEKVFVWCNPMEFCHFLMDSSGTDAIFLRNSSMSCSIYFVCALQSSILPCTLLASYNR